MGRSSAYFFHEGVIKWSSSWTIVIDAGISKHFPLIQRVNPGGLLLHAPAPAHIRVLTVCNTPVPASACSRSRSRYRRDTYLAWRNWSSLLPFYESFHTDATITKWRSRQLQLSSVDWFIIQRFSKSFHWYHEWYSLQLLKWPRHRS
jgi:hypothetical protein